MSSVIKTIWKGIGNTFIKGSTRVIKISHDDAGWIELGVGGLRLYVLSTAITANVTTTSVPAGSIGVTSHATGRGTPFYSDGTKWQVWVTGATTKASGAEVNTGTDDAKFVTAKAIADSTIGKVKASGAEMNTGTDDVKFLTPKAYADSDAAKAAATPVTADVFYFRTAAGVVKKVTLGDLATAIDGELNP